MTWHKCITRDSASNFSKCFFLLPVTHKNIQSEHYILHMQTHIIFSIAIVVCVVGFFLVVVFFCTRWGNNVQPTSLLKKAKAVHKKKSLLYLCSTQKHTQSQLSSYKRTKTVNFHVTFFISQNTLRLSQLSACHCCLLIQH